MVPCPPGQYQSVYTRKSLSQNGLFEHVTPAPQTGFLGNERSQCWMSCCQWLLPLSNGIDKHDRGLDVDIW